MSDVQQPTPPPPPPARGMAPLTVLPVRTPGRPGSSPVGVLFAWFFGTLFALSVAFNVILLITAIGFSFSSDNGLHERYHSGSKGAQDKIAIIRINGIIMEGLTDYAHKQIEVAARDKDVRAVVVRINSPGGTITASDDLYQRLRELRDGNSAKKAGPKPLVVSMGSMAASGGYYIAMPAKELFAERTTITGSIGVYAAFPNFKDLGDKYGFHMNTIKAGEVKDSGSAFHSMTAEERELWQDMVNHAFDQFMAVVENGRPNLKGKLRQVVIERMIPNRDENGQIKRDKSGKEERVKFVRRRADGGIFTADQAKKYGLIDQIGYLDDALAEAKKLAGLGGDYQAITYDRPQTLLDSFLGVKASPSSVMQLDTRKLARGAAPRLWYLAPQSELAGFLGAIGHD